MDIVDKYNAVAGACITLLSAVLGQAWLLFAVYLLLNVLDWLTGWYKARKKHEESSEAGFTGVLKKLGYWAVILVGFAVPAALIRLGMLIGLELAFLELLGWFVLASLLVNEARSILENLVETGYRIPGFLITGLAVTGKLIQDRAQSVTGTAKQEDEGDA